jgi:ATP-dependent DNA helicase Rep
MPPDLNAAQREAVAYRDGPCLILAGAGSGKTRVVAHKIAHLIRDAGFEATQIAALTFTNKAAREMQSRCVALLPDGQARGLTVSTFHSLGVSILRKEAVAAGLKPQFSIFDADDALAILQDLVGSSDRSLARRIQSRISLWKNALVSPNAAAERASGRDETVAAGLYRSYDATLGAYQALDFDDLIARPVRLFEEEPEILYRWQSRLRYLLVDEVQDTNACQYHLLRQLAGDRAQFTVVGDDDQAIYGWRGATLDNLAQIQRDYPQIRVITLEQNYRSSQRILAAANALIANNPKLFEKKLWSELGPGDALSVHAMNDEAAEAEDVVMRISARRFERQGKFSDYAVLYRGNHQARAFEEALRKEKIPYVLSGGQSFFERTEIKDVIAWLRVIVNEDDDPAFIRAMTTPRRGVGSVTLEALGHDAARRHVSLFAAACESGFAAGLDARRMEPIREFTAFVNRMQWRAAREPAGELFDEILSATGMRAWLFDSHDERGAQARWQNVLDFAQWIRQRAGESAASLAEVVQSVTLLGMLEEREGSEDAVRLSTLHAAKGLEFPHVFLVGVEEGLLPHKGEPDSDDASMGTRLEEERRLMYVGITRAQRSLTVSWCKKRRRAREVVAREVSRFVAEMKIDEQGPADRDAAHTTPKARLDGLMALLAKPRAG